MVEIRVSRVDTDGPLFNGMAAHAISEFCDEVAEESGKMGVRTIRQQLDRVLRHPTGRYRASIDSDNVGHRAVIHDSGIVYGTWLEGTSSRNRTTRFRGYATFRKMTPVINYNTGQIANRIVRVRRMRFIGDIWTKRPMDHGTASPLESCGSSNRQLSPRSRPPSAGRLRLRPCWTGSWTMNAGRRPTRFLCEMKRNTCKRGEITPPK